MTPYLFKPITMERPWGGRKINELFGRELPSEKKIGESWELVDRSEACSEVLSGPGFDSAKPETLHTLWQEKRQEVFGTRAPDVERFPILIKILDAQANLSIRGPAPASSRKQRCGISSRPRRRRRFMRDLKRA
jgi:mannose-6-phosphate isomerase